MTGVAVAIATTLGPVTVARITPEHPDINSVACIEHSDDELPISAAYNSFVRPPTGIIKRCFEHDSFLLELSGSIEVGDSWKLGVFAAHALHYASRLARIDEAPERVIWATGDMRRDFTVPPVGYVIEKLQRSRAFFDQLRDRGVPVLIVLPRGNAELLGERLWDECAIRKDDVVAVACANDLMAALGLPPVDVRAHAGKAGPWTRRRAAAVAGAIVAMAVAGAALWYDRGPGLSMWNRSNLLSRDLETLMSAMDVEGISTMTGGPFVMKLRPEGAAIVEVRTPDMKEWFRETGRWWVDNGSFCFHFARFGQGAIRCPRITVNGTSIKARRGDGTLLDWRFTAVSPRVVTSRHRD